MYPNYPCIVSLVSVFRFIDCSTCGIQSKQIFLRYTLHHIILCERKEIKISKIVLDERENLYLAIYKIY